METVSTVEVQIAEKAKKYPNEALTNLHQYIDKNLLQVSFDMLKKKGACGVDRMSWGDCNKQRNERIPELLTAFKSGKYRAPNIRRVYIPKGDGKQRPLGLPTVEDGNVRYPEEGTPQGGTISQLLSNIYLHYVLDEWFIKQIQPLLKGKSFIIRFADDFLLGFTDKADAERVMKVLPKRLGKYGLILHPGKTKLIELRKREGEKPDTFDFLGFTHYMGKSRKGMKVLKRKTSSKKFRMSIKRLYEWLRNNRHRKMRDVIKELNQKLQGHYGYYGIAFNSRRIEAYYYQTKRILHYWLNRRGGKPKWNWEKVKKLTEEWIRLIKPKIYHSYQLAKP
jgi:hypothetical protein